MSEDIVERLRQRISSFGTDRDRADAAAEIERLREENKRMRAAIPDAFLSSDGEEIEPHVAILYLAQDLARAQFDLKRVDALATALEQMQANLTEALRLMEPVAEAAKAQDDDRLPGTCTVLQPIGPLRAISDFVTRMRGEPHK